jgi:hypothetical protein
MNGQYAGDPARCYEGTFPCGDETCVGNRDVCVDEPDSERPELHCEAASDRGCAGTGIADCNCLTYDPGTQVCESLEPPDAARGIAIRPLSGDGGPSGGGAGGR